MKWWGWGDEDFEFPVEQRPALWPWIRTRLGIQEERLAPPVARSAVQLPEARVNGALAAELVQVLGAQHVAQDEDQRLLHACGRSYPDLLELRRGQLEQAPDLVVFPGNHAEVEAVLQRALQHGARIIPFGGGTNIVGGINRVSAAQDCVISLDLRRMTRLLALDTVSGTATIEAGALGPVLESDLKRRGWSLGHVPDSFQFSTLGGWLATRSAGMQSDAHGKIEDMLVALRVVTPSGTLSTKAVPRAATGPSLNQALVGSEGILGVITEATMRVHPEPACRLCLGLLLPSFEAGLLAMRECVQGGTPADMFRLSDEEETQLGLHMKRPRSGLKAGLQGLMAGILKRRGFGQPCLMLVGFEGPRTRVQQRKKAVLRVLARHGAFNLGPSVGETWSADKFNLPYLRDWLMSRCCLVDVAETAVAWASAPDLYQAVCRAMRKRFLDLGVQGYLGCHVSHTYQTGACFYFTFATLQQPGEELAQYRSYKRLMTETFLSQGGALSHHHAIGLEHRPWITQELGPVGLAALRGLKTALDPEGIMNPGKLLP